jgi:hypothetical protein
MCTKLKNTLFSKTKFKSKRNLNSNNNNSFHNDTGIVIVSAWAKNRSNLEFLFVNKSFCEVMDGTEESFLKKNIRMLMP